MNMYDGLAVAMMAYKQVQADNLQGLIQAKLDRISRAIAERGQEVMWYWNSSKGYLYLTDPALMQEREACIEAVKSIARLKREVRLEFAGAKDSWL